MGSSKQLFQLCVFLIPIGFGIIGCNTITAGDSAKAAPIISQEPNHATIPPTASPTSPPQMLSPTANPTKEPKPTVTPPITPEPEPTPIPAYIIYDVEQTFKISNEGPSTVALYV